MSAWLPWKNMGETRLSPSERPWWTDGRALEFALIGPKNTDVHVFSLVLGVSPCCGWVWKSLVLWWAVQTMVLWHFSRPVHSCRMENLANGRDLFQTWTCWSGKMHVSFLLKLNVNQMAIAHIVFQASVAFVISSLFSLERWPASTTSHF